MQSIPEVILSNPPPRIGFHTFGLYLIQQAIRQGKTVMYIDVELTPEYTKERMEKLLFLES